MTGPIVLTLGAGPGIGAHTAIIFAQKGFRIVSAARSVTDKRVNEQHMQLHLDLAIPDEIRDVFRKTEEIFGAPPSVLIHNAASRTLLPADDPLSSLSLQDYATDMAINLNSVVIAAQEAVKGFAKLPAAAPKVFIYSGNKQNVMCDPKVLSFGIAKTGAARLMWDCSAAYRSRGYRFYFTDERLEDGTPARELMDAKARAELYLKLAEDEHQRPWHYTYVKSSGYVDFRPVDKAWDVDGLA